jgi:hypothetical protein
MSTRPDPGERGFRLVTYQGDGYIHIIHPIEWKPLEKDQSALKALVRYYENQALGAF